MRFALPACRVVMGGPHVAEVPGEALGRDGGPRHADSVALGEADETWPRIVEDAAAGRLKAHCHQPRETSHIIPIESGRGSPYGCDFCMVGFFGDSIRYRSNQSIVNEMLRLKARAQRTQGKIVVFFVDDNFAINVKRTAAALFSPCQSMLPRRSLDGSLWPQRAPSDGGVEFLDQVAAALASAWPCRGGSKVKPVAERKSGVGLRSFT